MTEKNVIRGVRLERAVAALAVALMTVLQASAQSHIAAGATGNGGLALDARVTIVVGADEPGPVYRAADDLAADFEKVFGTKPKIADHAGEGGVTVLIGEAAKLPEDKRPANVHDAESFSIAVSGNDLVLAGADMRGTIYAIYQFSQEYLGVDPMYYWTDHEPLRRTRVELPAGLNKAYPAPAFKYRGFFINDEDLLTGWAPGAKDHAGISLEAWNKVYETMPSAEGEHGSAGDVDFSRRSSD